MEKRLWTQTRQSLPKICCLDGTFCEIIWKQRCWKDPDGAESFWKSVGNENKVPLSAKTGRVSDGYLNTRVNNPKLYSWVDPTWGESGEGFVTDPKKGKNRDGERAGGEYETLRMKGSFISRSVPDVPVCCRPLCYALLFLVRRGIQGKEEYSLVLSALHFFTLKRSRTPTSSLNSPFSASCLLRV